MTLRRGDRLGRGLTALCGGALAFNLLLVLALLVVLAANGLGHFWQAKLVRLELADGTHLLGELRQREASRIQLKVANREVNAADFVWVNTSNIVSRAVPRDVVLLERLEWGDFYGTPVELRHGADPLAVGSERVWAALGPIQERKQEELRAIRRLERRDIGDVNYRIEQLRLAGRRLDLAHVKAASPERSALEQETARAQAEYDVLARQLATMREELLSDTLVVETAAGQRRDIPVGQVVRAVRPNTLGPAARLGLYFSRLREFVFDQPRESNTEGGIFPAIFGTVLMVFLMSFAVAPLGVLAALYLREYAKQGVLVRLVRIAVNNLAGVPSIVFGVFGLGFFVYLVGGSIDRWLFAESLPAPTFGTGGILWASLTLALLTVPVVIVATEEGLAAVPRVSREGSLALGATKFETILRVVLPASAPGILTGMILAMARAAGEVAPLMIVGMVKLAPALPVDRHFPFVHLERKFMHLGFHIYDVGFQSPDTEATKPLVFATALLLIAVVTTMNLVAIAVRDRLRSRYASSAV